MLRYIGIKKNNLRRLFCRKDNHAFLPSRLAGKTERYAPRFPKVPITEGRVVKSQLKTQHP